MNGAQLRAARAYLRWTVAELSQRSGVAPNTVTRVEAEKSVNTATLKALQGAVEAAGVVFGPDGGVRLQAGSREPITPTNADQVR